MKSIKKLFSLKKLSIVRVFNRFSTNSLSPITVKDIGNVTAENKQKYPIVRLLADKLHPSSLIPCWFLSLQKNVPMDLKPILNPLFEMSYGGSNSKSISNLWLVFVSVLWDLDFQVIVNQLGLSLSPRMQINVKAVMNDLTLIW